jgi:hypothetical protein
VRIGDDLSVILPFVGTTYLKLNARGFAMAKAILVLGCLILAVKAGQMYRALTATQDATIGRTA